MNRPTMSDAEQESEERLQKAVHWQDAFVRAGMRADALATALSECRAFMQQRTLDGEHTEWEVFLAAQPPSEASGRSGNDG